VRVEYNDSDCPTTPKGEEEAYKEEMNDYNRMIAAGDASVMVRSRLQLGLLSVRMREHGEKERSGSNGSEGKDTSKEGQFSSPGMPPVPFLHIFFTLVVERSAKADIPHRPPSILKFLQSLM
jgi:hypothetical protein